MARSAISMRLTDLFSIIVLGASINGCRREATQTRERERVDQEQNVTANTKPQDAAFKDFAKSWRNFISTSPQLALPVVGSAKSEATAPPPVISSECVPSQAAGGYVPQVTISWHEPATTAAAARSRAQQQAGEVPLIRLDLALHHDAFSRNLYSSALSTDKLKRFSIPSKSALVNNPQAVLQTGPGLLPKLVDFRTELLQDSRTNRQIEKLTVVLSELTPGISYAVRASRMDKNEWNTDRQLVFQAPVCPSSF